YTVAGRFYTEAFNDTPQLAGEQPSLQRYNAACAVAMAGCGQGKDAANLPDKDYLRLRTRALTWLRDDLAAWRKVLEQHGDKASPAVAQQMRHWQTDADFQGVRDKEALAKLPQAERADWQKLWSEVEATRRRCEDKPPPGN